MKEPIKVIDVDKNKCVNCHACIAVCPVKYCNDGSGDHINLNHDMCIGCGKCITACTHEARFIIDDFDEFMKNIKTGEKIIAFTAPSVATNWPNQFLNLNGWLKSLGVESIFDVSFGAELTVKTYGQLLKKSPNTFWISSPCPTITAFIQTYMPEFIKNLVPADSPMVHTIKMVNEFYPKYKNYKFAVISPCIAKKREFNESEINAYNVTFISIDRFLKKNKINLEDYPEIQFENPSPERAVVFPNPGGLIETARRDYPELLKKAKNIEGPSVMYEYLTRLSECMKKHDRQPNIFIDCLNCFEGCNGGTGTSNKEECFEAMDVYIEQRKKNMEKIYKKAGIQSKQRSKNALNKILEKYWNPNLYLKSFNDLSRNNTIKIPNQKEIKEIYRQMKKTSKKDILNCASCGYNKCENMAIAIYNGLNTPQNCHHYQAKLIKGDNLKLKRTKRELNKYKNLLEEKVKRRTKELTQLNEKLQIEIDAHKQTENILKENEKRLRLQLAYITSLETDINQFKLIDLIDVETLQEIQDAFSESHNVASLITDQEGNTITKPSNFCDVCKIVRKTEIGLKQCILSDKILGEKAKKLMRPVYENCHSCGFVDACAPIIVAGKHIGNWLIGQVNTGGVNRNDIRNYANKIEADENKLLKAYDNMQEMDIKKFKKILHLLGIFAKKISLLGYNNLKLAKDIIEKENLEQEILNARKLEAVGILAGGIAHDFNNILTAILGNISLAMLDADMENENLINTLKSAEKASLRAKDLSQQLLTFSKGGNPIKKITSIKDLIEESVKFIIKGKSVQCEFDLDENVWPVDIDQGQISQVINNLIINACQSMDKNGELKVSCKNINISEDNKIPVRKGRYIKISIADKGKGIAPENIKKIFDPYFTTKKDGTGLGLATSFSIIKKHDGYISVDSKLDIGTVFHIYLPASTSTTKSMKFEGTKPIPGSGKILIMDDDIMIRDFLRKGLDSLGYQTVCADNGEQALKEYVQAYESNKPFDIVITDLTVPGGMGGDTLIAKLKEKYPDIKAIVSSGYSNDPIMANYKDYGFSGFVTKPFNMTELSNVIHNVLANK